MDKEIKKGAFIAFEGIDGSGKSTQSSLLIQRLKSMEIPCYATMEPTDSPIGSLIRQIMTGRIRTDNKVIAALFAADRLDHLLNEVDGIAAKIDEGTTVVTDRYYFSSYAYNSVHMPMEWVIKANEQSSAILRPSVTVFIDVEPDTALERIARNRFRRELFEKKSMLVRVRENYMKAFELLEKEEKVVILDGSLPQDKLSELVWNEVREYL
ncbi:MAG: dTMP kinase [Butyrivibrio sp.]|nr:dTMP kinase [Butyrivibrio sp.]